MQRKFQIGKHYSRSMAVDNFSLRVVFWKESLAQKITNVFSLVLGGVEVKIHLGPDELHGLASMLTEQAQALETAQSQWGEI